VRAAAPVHPARVTFSGTLLVTSSLTEQSTWARATLSVAVATPVELMSIRSLAALDGVGPHVWNDRA
jgi:hypothetical protein